MITIEGYGVEMPRVMSRVMHTHMLKIGEKKGETTQVYGCRGVMGLAGKTSSVGVPKPLPKSMPSSLPQKFDMLRPSLYNLSYLLVTGAVRFELRRKRPYMSAGVSIGDFDECSGCGRLCRLGAFLVVAWPKQN